MRLFKHIILALVASQICCNVVSLANDNSKLKSTTYYQQHATGWHWYNEQIIKKLEKKKPVQTPYRASVRKSESTPNPTKTMLAIRAMINRSLNQAILNPTENNVRAYLSLQNQISNQSTKFANTWQKVLLNNPDLNYSLVHPTNNTAKQIYLDLHQEKEIKAINDFFKTRGLFFFYKSTCVYCHKFAPIVKDFAERYGITIIPVTLDGISLPSFPNSKMDNGQAQKFNISITPALFAVNPYNNQAVPVAYGFISESDLRQRILDVVNNFNSGI